MGEARSVQGRLLVSETGAAIEGVTVVALDGNQRLGSSVTDADGRFVIRYGGDSEPRARSVSVHVLAEDASGAHVLYQDVRARTSAGAVESYAIRIAHDALVKAKVHVPLPKGQDPLARFAQVLHASRDAEQGVQPLVQETARRLDARRARALQVEQRITEDLRQVDRRATVPVGDVLGELVATTRQTIERRLAPFPRRAVLPLTAAARDGLVGDRPAGARIPDTSVAPVLFGPPAGDRVRADLLDGPCRDHRPLGSECAPVTEPLPAPAHEPAAEPAPGDLLAAVARLTQPLTGLPDRRRPTARDVGSGVGALELRGGPADAEALFDFQVLQLALGDVSRDLLDERLVATAAALEEELVRCGGTVDPQAVTLNGLLREARWTCDTMTTVVNGPRPRPRATVVRDHRDGTPSRPGTEALDDPMGHLRALLEDLERRLQEPYRFTVFGADGTGTAINVGLLLTYRQSWRPVSYQAGKLVRTVTLAPKEERAYSRKVVRTTRRRTETRERTRSLRKVDATETNRAVRDIVETAQRRTAMEASYTGSVLGAGVSAEAAQTSSDTKQAFREAVRQAAAEYETERSVDVTFESSEEVSAEESGKLVNPNDELAVTYLFYELQRRYRVSEKLHRVTPVILVAQPVPAPHEITIGWILQHDWILRRALLDSTFTSALDYVAESLAGEEAAVGALKQNLDAQRKLVAELKDNLVTVRNDLGQRYAALERAIRSRDAVVAREQSEGFFMRLTQFFTGDLDDVEGARLREQMARDAYERIQTQERELSDRLDREVSVLAAMTDKWVDAQRSYLDKTVEVQRLRLHIKQNILHYMQAIWDHEPVDQRTLRLRDVPVPQITGSLEYEVVRDEDHVPMPPTWAPPTVLRAHLDATVSTQTDPLADLADLDRPIGYKANYAVFPLRAPHILTSYLMVPYANAASGLHDPHLVGNFTRSALDAYVCCLRRTLPAEDLAAIEPGINLAYQHLLSSPQPTEEVITIPTDSLYIEALPATQPILEDFKLRHRAVDVTKAEADAARLQLENLRRGARILAGDLADPDIEKMTVVQGAAGVVVGDDP